MRSVCQTALVSMLLSGLGVLSVQVEASERDHPDGKRALAKYNGYYDKGKFDSLAGEDGVMTKDDWEAGRNRAESWACGDRRWEEAVKFDADGDGALSLAEARAYKQAERRRLVRERGKAWNWAKDNRPPRRNDSSDGAATGAGDPVATGTADQNASRRRRRAVAAEAKKRPKAARYAANHLEAAKRATRHPRAAKYGANHPRAAKQAASHPNASKKVARRPQAAKCAATHPRATKAIARKVK